MRYSFFHTFRAGKIFLVILLLFSVFLLWRSIKAIPGRNGRIGRGVSLAGKAVGEMTAEEARAVIRELAPVLYCPPIDAYIETATGGVVPDINGLEVDIEETLHKLLAAGVGENIIPAYRQIPAEVNLGDFPLRPVYRGNPEKPQVTFLVNVAWGNEYLGELQEVLMQEEAGATFFLTGRWVKGNPEEALMISRAKFEIASHGYSDALSMGEAEADVIREDMDKSLQVIKEICGVNPLYISTHRGELSPAVLEAAAERGLRVIMWTVDTVDWQLPGVEAIFKKISAKAGNGSLILMHPTMQTADFLRRIIPALRQKGLEPVKLSELLSPFRDYRE